MFFTFSPANAAPIPAYIQDSVPNAQMVGNGRMTVWFWDVYDTRLVAPDGRFAADQPFALSLTYLRDFNGEDIAERSVEEMRGQGFSDELKLATWFSQMQNLFPDVRKGETLTGVRTTDGYATFYHDAKPIGSIRDTDFSHRFFDIWLSASTSAPELRAQLLPQ